MRLPLLIFGVAAVLFSTVAITNVPVNGWFHDSSEGIDVDSAQIPLPETTETAPAVAPSGAGEIRLRSSCDECGVVQSTRRIAAVGTVPAVYEVTIRLGNGSTFVLSDATPVNMHPGERIRIIGGNRQAGR